MIGHLIARLISMFREKFIIFKFLKIIKLVYGDDFQTQINKQVYECRLFNNMF